MSLRVVRNAVTSFTSPTFTPRKVTAAPLFSPRTEPGKNTVKRWRGSNQFPELSSTIAPSTRAMAPSTNTPTARGWAFALTGGPAP